MNETEISIAFVATPYSAAENASLFSLEPKTAIVILLNLYCLMG